MLCMNVTTLEFCFLCLLSFYYLNLIIPLWKIFKKRVIILNPDSPGPTSYPIVGCLFLFYRNRYRLLDWYTEMLSASPTQTIIISRLGARRTIVTANPQNVEYILKRNFNNFPKGEPFTEILWDFLGNGIFNVDGHLWSNQRKIVSHEFTVKSLHDYVVNILKEEVEKKLLPVLESAADDNHQADVITTVDLQDLLTRLAFDLVCKFSLGFDPCCLEQYHSNLDTSNPVIQAFDVASEICARRGAAPLSIMWRVKRFLSIGSEKRIKKAIHRIHVFVDNIIRDKKASMLAGGVSLGQDLVSKMLSTGEVEEEFVRDTVINLIMAGRETTSAAMTWLFYLLSCHPNVENELLKELEFIDDESLSKCETLKEMRFLKACICESMRLYPPVAWDSKHAIVNDSLPDGTKVEAGDRVTYFPYGMGRMEVLWGKDWFEFKPERWVCEVDEGRIIGLKNVCPYMFPVFQAGPRVCLGKEMAFIQIKYVVASILKRFKIRRTVNDTPPVFVPLLTAHMAGGFKVFVRTRAS